MGGDRVTVLFEPQKQVAESEDVNTQRSIPEYPVTLICKGWKVMEMDVSMEIPVGDFLSNLRLKPWNGELFLGIEIPVI